MILLEGSDTQIKFKIQEIEGSVKSDLNLTQYDKFLWVLAFVDESQLELVGKVENGVVVFDIFGENTLWKAGTLKMDIRGLKEMKKVRFNAKTIKGKILSSIKMPDGM